MNMQTFQIVLVFIFCCIVQPVLAAPTCKTTTIPASTGHLVDNDDGTITDAATQLMWKKCLEGFTFDSGANSCAAAGDPVLFDWSDALGRPAIENGLGTPTGGHTDWRMPNIKELQSIIEVQCHTPAINGTKFGDDTPAAKVWSNSFYANDSALSWCIDFTDGRFSYENQTTETYHVRLVRDAPAEPED
jgi:hypothetical protein